MDEVHVNENEVRILKAINGEIGYKSQSLQLPAAPILLVNQMKGDYTIELKPTIATPVFGFNVTSANPDKRRVFGGLRFRQAMSVAINRAEINEIAFFGLGEPRQYTAFSPSSPFVSKEMETHYAQFDQALARKLLDEVGLVDKDGDGIRDLPGGARLAINVQFATQGMPSQIAELVAQHWTSVGVQTTIKDVTPDEFRSAQSSNPLDVIRRLKGQPVAIVLGNAELFQPPFENYFGGQVGILWAEYTDSKGEKGVKPPAFVDQMLADIDAFQSTEHGSAKTAEIGARLVKNMTENLLFIGAVQAPAPVNHRNRVKNFPSFKTWSYEYHRTYPYRPEQWFLADRK